MIDFGASRDTKETGMCRKTIMLIDASLSPHKNNRSAKMGSGNQTFASAVLGYNPRTKQVTSGDGTGSNLVRYPFEPDNWIHRKHGKGFDLVWASRLIVDKTNKAQDKKNRSTHVIDQSEDQLYGNFADLFWICKTGVETDFSVNGAGYASSGDGNRDALALSCALNEGFISDGKKFAQLAHVFCFLEPEKEKPPPPKRPPVPTPGGGNPNVATVATPPVPTVDPAFPNGGINRPIDPNSNEIEVPPGQGQGSTNIPNTGSGQIFPPPPGGNKGGFINGGDDGFDHGSFPPGGDPSDPLHTGKF